MYIFDMFKFIAEINVSDAQIIPHWSMKLT